MNNKSNFLNLPSDLPGDARRHVPFRSIIHKPLCLIFVLVFVFFIMFSYRTSVSALAAPELNPVYNTDIVQIEEYVNGLSSGQMDVFNIILGFYLASQAGAAKYQIADPYADQSGVLNWLKSCGVQLYNDFAGWLGGYDPVYGIDKDKFLAILMGAAVLADQYTDQSDFVSDIENSTNYFLPFNQSLQIGLNQIFSYSGGLYDWQYSTGDFVANFNYLMYNLGLYLNQYNLYLADTGLPWIRCNVPVEGSRIYSNCVFDGSIYNGVDTMYVNYNGVCVFYNSNNGSLYNGNPSTSYPRIVFARSDSSNPGFIDNVGYFNGSRAISKLGSSYNLNLNNFNTVNAYVQYVLDYISTNVNWSVTDLIRYIRYGSTYETSDIIYVNTDLNFDSNSNKSYLQVQNDLLLDIKGLLSDLIDTNELREPVFNNFYDLNGQPVSDPATINVSVNAVSPESGIDIPSNLFAPLTKDGGYISYLWYMTKPLVQYTSDFVQTMVFDGNEDFDITGPGAIVFGVISLGLIGGLVVKCLL